MKNTLKRVLALVLVIACVVPFVACAKPKLDLEKAEANLKEEGYTVVYNSDVKSAGIEATLHATKDGKEVSIAKYETTKAAKLAYQSAKLSIENEIEEAKLALKTAKYMLDKFEDDLSDIERNLYEEKVNDLKEDIEELKAELKTIGRSGKYVWSGDKEAIKASK